MATRSPARTSTLLALAAVAAAALLLPSAAARQTGGGAPSSAGSGSGCDPHAVYRGEAIELGQLVQFTLPVDEVRGFLVDHLHGANAYLELADPPHAYEDGNTRQGDGGGQNGNNGNHNGQDDQAVRFKYLVFGMLGEYCG